MTAMKAPANHAQTCCAAGCKKQKDEMFILCEEQHAGNVKKEYRITGTLKYTVNIFK
jgi:hypothetical protein